MANSPLTNVFMSNHFVVALCVVDVYLCGEQINNDVIRFQHQIFLEKVAERFALVWNNGYFYEVNNKNETIWKYLYL